MVLGVLYTDHRTPNKKQFTGGQNSDCALYETTVSQQAGNVCKKQPYRSNRGKKRKQETFTCNSNKRNKNLTCNGNKERVLLQ